MIAREPAAPPGRYEIRLDELPRATDADRHRLAAEEAMSRAGERYREGDGRRGGRRWPSTGGRRGSGGRLGDRRQEARALYAAAVLARLVDDTREALKAAEAVLPLWQALGDPLWEARDAERDRARPLAAGRHRGGADGVRAGGGDPRRIGDRYGEGAADEQPLRHRPRARGELKAGIACYERRAAGAARGEGGGAGRLRADQRRPGLRHPGRARPGARPLPPGAASGCAPPATARARRGPSTTSACSTRSWGTTRRRWPTSARALEVFRALEQPPLAGLRPPQHRAGLPGARRVAAGRLGLRGGAAAAARGGRPAPRRPRRSPTSAMVYGELGRAREALECQQRALELRRESGDRWGEGVALTQAGRAALALGDLPAALADFDRAVELLHAAGSRADEAEALRSRGDAWLARGEPAKALREPGGGAAAGAGDRPPAERGAGRAARWRRRSAALGRLAAARAHAGAAARAPRDAAHPDRQPGPARLLLRPPATGPTSSIIDLLMASHRAEPRGGLGPRGAGDRRARPRPHPGRAAERGRRRRPPGGGAGAARAPHLAAAPAERQDRAGLAASTPREHGRARGARGGALRRAARPRRRGGRDPRASPGYAALAQPQPLSAAEIQALLDPDTLLLAYALGEERSYLWAVTPETHRELRAARPRPRSRRSPAG